MSGFEEKSFEECDTIDNVEIVWRYRGLTFYFYKAVTKKRK